MNIENIMDQVFEEWDSIDEIFKNEYFVCGDATAIHITRNNGNVYEVFIDSDDVEKVLGAGTWAVMEDNRSDNFYVCRNINVNGKGTRQLIHRFIMGTPKGLVVDHLNHDTLDNRKSNLRSVTHAENQQNRKGASKHSKTGIRGVSFDKKSNKWRAQIAVNCKKMFLGLFDDIKSAEQAVIEARKQYMPYAN